MKSQLAFLAMSSAFVVAVTACSSTVDPPPSVESPAAATEAKPSCCPKTGCVDDCQKHCGAWTKDHTMCCIPDTWGTFCTNSPGSIIDNEPPPPPAPTSTIIQPPPLPTAH